MTHNAPVSHAALSDQGRWSLGWTDLLYPTLPHPAQHQTTQQIIWNGICSNSQKKQTRSIGQLLILHLPSSGGADIAIAAKPDIGYGNQ